MASTLIDYEETVTCTFEGELPVLYKLASVIELEVSDLSMILPEAVKVLNENPVMADTEGGPRTPFTEKDKYVPAAISAVNKSVK